MGAPPAGTTPRLFGRGTWPEVSRIGDILRAETVGGALLRRGRGHRAGLGELAVARRVQRAERACGSGRRRCTWT